MIMLAVLYVIGSNIRHLIGANIQKLDKNNKINVLIQFQTTLEIDDVPIFDITLKTPEFKAKELEK